MSGSPTTVRASTLDAIGGTPVVRLSSKVVASESAEVLVKLEYFNPTGSYKDRMALSMIEEAEKRGDLRPGDDGRRVHRRQHRIVAGVRLRGQGVPVQGRVVGCVRPREAPDDARLRRGRRGGAEPGREDHPGPDPEDAGGGRGGWAQEGAYPTDQLNNRDALDGYGKIGEELLAQVGGPIDAFCGGVGVGGMLLGVAAALRAGGSTASIVALEPAARRS